MFNPLSVLNNYGKRISTHKIDYNELPTFWTPEWSCPSS